MTLFRQLEDVFGPEFLAPALFYGHSPALRFELAGGQTRTAQFLQIIDRARAVLGHAFADAATVVVILVVYGDKPPVRQWNATRKKLAWVGLEPPVSLPHFRRIQPADEAPQTHFAFELPAARLPELLWCALAYDLGIAPAYPGRVTIAAPALGLLACPYDSRGLDIIGPNVARLADLYTTFNPWLLDYDRAAMDMVFAATSSGC